MKNNYYFRDDSLNRIKYLLENSNKDKNEYGALICFDDLYKLIVLGSVCKGDSCSIQFKDKDDCGTFRTKGTYHTHPDRHDASPALLDLIAHLEDKDIISCIGGDSQILCYISKDEDIYNKKENADEIKKNLYIEKNYNNREKVDVIDEINYLDFKKYILNRYFDTYNLKNIEKEGLHLKK